VFALPLHVGGIRLGVIDLYRARPGPLHHDELADALLLADIACALLLDPMLDEQPPSHGREPELAGPLHPEVHQATGMMIVQLEVNAALAATGTPRNPVAAAPDEWVAPVRGRLIDRYQLVLQTAYRCLHQRRPLFRRTHLMVTEDRVHVHPQTQLDGLAGGRVEGLPRKP
jgi:hypothetical protein